MSSYQAEYQPLAAQAANSAFQSNSNLVGSGLDPNQFSQVFQGLIGSESGYNPNAMNASGAYGLAQLMPGTASMLGVNAYDPHQNLLGGADYFASLVANNGGNYDAAIAQYKGIKNPDTAKAKSMIQSVQDWMNNLGYGSDNISSPAAAIASQSKPANSTPWVDSLVDSLIARLPAWFRDLFTVQGLIILGLAALFIFGGAWNVIKTRN